MTQCHIYSILGRFNSIKTMVQPRLRLFHASLHPCGKCVPISTEESATILRLYRERKTDEAIGGEVGRTGSSITNHIGRLRLRGVIDDRKKAPRSERLTAAEVQVLKTVREGGKTWRDCLSLFPTRSAQVLKDSMGRLKRTEDNTDRSKQTEMRSPRSWTEDEDRKLAILRGENRLRFAEIAKLMPGRSTGSIRSRYRRVTTRHDRVGRIDYDGWSDQDVQELRSRLAAGSTHKEISLSMNRSIRSIASKAYRLGVETSLGSSQSEPGHSLWTSKESAQLLDMKSSGATMLQIVSALGRSYASVNSRWEMIRKGTSVRGRPRKNAPASTDSQV